MDLLKQIPIKYQGELHQVKLINFSVEKDEIAAFVPKEIKIRDYNGRALISMVNVKLRNMHPSFLPFLNFHYQHIGFRLLVDDSEYVKNQPKGIYFIRSFTDNKLVTTGGKYFTNYNLEPAAISENKNKFKLTQGDKILEYELCPTEKYKESPELYEHVKNVDRAYSQIDHKLHSVQIMRETWPIEWICCKNFSTNFFKTARLEGAFCVQNVIPYTWLPPQPIH